MIDTDNTSALTTIINALTPLKSEERQRTVQAALLFLGETARAPSPESKAGTSHGGAGYVDTEHGTGDGGYSTAANEWMKQHGVSAEELDRVFHFNNDGSFDIHDVPGKSKKEKSLNTYILAGLGTYLTTKERAFDDALARGLCEKIGCYDAANHSVHLKNKGAEFSGDKHKGYTLTNVGVKRGASLVKEVAGAAT